MAIFERQQELGKQLQPKKFKSVTGWKKGALSLAGYKADGTKNTFGKYFGHGNVLADHYVASALAKGTDAGEVIDSAESEQWGYQIATAKFASNFVGGGAGKGLMGKGAGAGAMGKGAAAGGGGLFAKAGTKGLGAGGGATKAGAFLSKAGGGASKTVAQGGAGGVLDSMNNSAATDSAAAGLDKGVEKSDAVSKFGDVNNPESYSTEADYLESTGGQGGSVNMNERSEEGSKFQGLTDASQAIPIVGDLASAWNSKFVIADKLKNKRKQLSQRKMPTDKNVYDLY